MNIKHVLMTGCTGRIGPRVLEEFSSTDCKIRVLIKNKEDVTSTINAHAHELIWGDILNRNTWLNAIDGIDSVIHLAGVSDEKEGVLSTNYHSSQLLANACVNSTVTRIVFASSSCVVRKSPWLDTRVYSFLPIDETHSMMPSGNYGLSKLLSENILNSAVNSNSNLQVVSLRLTWVLSNAEIDNRAWESIPNDIAISSLWSYVHIDDAARAFVLAHESSFSRPFEAMYISAEDTFSKHYSKDLINMYYPELHECNDNLLGHDSFYSYAKASRLIGYNPRNSIHSSL